MRKDFTALESITIPLAKKKRQCHVHGSSSCTCSIRCHPSKTYDPSRHHHQHEVGNSLHDNSIDHQTRKRKRTRPAAPYPYHIPAATQALAQGLASARHFSAFILPFLVLVMRLTMRRRRNSDGAHLTEIISEVAEKEKKTGWVDLTSHSAVATRENRECMDICG